MKVVFRPCCSNCGYEFQELHAVAVKGGYEFRESDGVIAEAIFSPEIIFKPSHCPKCNEPVEGITYFVEYNDGGIFHYSKSFSDKYTEGLKL